jgi:hypothetical protein
MLNRLRMMAWLGQRCDVGYGRQVTSVTSSKAPSKLKRLVRATAGSFWKGHRAIGTGPSRAGDRGDGRP